MHNYLYHLHHRLSISFCSVVTYPVNEAMKNLPILLIIALKQTCFSFVSITWIHRQFERIWHKKKTPLNHARLRKQIARCNSLANKDKATYYRALVNENGDDPKKLCQVLRSTLHRIPDKVLPSNSSHKKLADQFAAFFTNKIAKIRESFSSSSSFPLKSSLSKDDLKNYHPVSGLSFISKLVERVVASQLSRHVSLHGLENENQSAYRHGHSTETALLSTKNQVHLSLARGEATAVVLLDQSAAFDTIDHDKLLDCLRKWFGVGGRCLD